MAKADKDQIPGRTRSSREKPEVRRRLLIEATIRCLGEGGLSAFTIDRICKEAGVARGLINHYFKSKDDLLVEVYKAMTEYLAKATYEVLDDPVGTPEQHLASLVDACCDAEAFDQRTLRAWLSLWGELPSNSELKALQQDRYLSFRNSLAKAITQVAGRRGVQVDGGQMALKLIALFDGLWLQWCIDPGSLTPKQARDVCIALLESDLGPIAPAMRVTD